MAPDTFSCSRPNPIFLPSVHRWRHRDDAAIQQHRQVHTASRLASLETLAYHAEAAEICAADPIEQVAG